jgi:hypothetical protein
MLLAHCSLAGDVAKTPGPCLRCPGKLSVGVDKVSFGFHLPHVATGAYPVAAQTSFGQDCPARLSPNGVRLRRAFRYHGKTTAKRQRPSVCRHSCKTHRLNVVAQHPTADRSADNASVRRSFQVNKLMELPRHGASWPGESRVGQTHTGDRMTCLDVAVSDSRRSFFYRLQRWCVDPIRIPQSGFAVMQQPIPSPGVGVPKPLSCEPDLQ